MGCMSNDNGSLNTNQFTAFWRSPGLIAHDKFTGNEYVFLEELSLTIFLGKYSSVNATQPFATKFSLPLFLEKSPTLKPGTPVFAQGNISGKYCQIFVVKTRK